ncbi:MAG: LPS export ABC transporter periplasmic protein LptC [Marivibrio sp.]|uniref:LPS export ABC transporter periplasmic protein LptC n=1 Tax=Marivibrio sp. TaxID=2039719 RepID=UPI0032EBA512
MTDRRDQEPTPPRSGAASPAAGAPPRGARIPLGRRATRLNPVYGRLVGWLKVLLPTVAVALVLLVAAWPLIVEQEARFADALSGADRRAAENLEVRNARYTGIEEDGQPFTVTAESMHQESVDATVVELVGPKADILLANGAWVAVTAANGTLNRAAQVLELTDDVNVFHDLGYEFRTQQAILDLVGGSAFGGLPVEGQGPFGYIEGEGFRVEGRGDRIKLTGKSKVVIYPERGDGS